MATTLNKIEIRWDISTAYDLFSSLFFLHSPETLGLRSSWAAGMRQRLPQAERQVLAEYVEHLAILPPLSWLRELDQPKDAQSVLNHYATLPPIEQVMIFIEFHGEIRSRIEAVVARQSWDDEDMDALMTYYREVADFKRTRKQLTSYLDGLAKGLAVVQGVPAALQMYYELFFAEEEQRIAPYLESGLKLAQKRLSKLGLIDWIAEYSRGAKLDEKYFEPTDSLTLVPSFWISPFIVRDFVGDGGILFGVRPPDVPLIPGELIPDSLLNTLNALSNPTRLKILRYVFAEELSATQIAARLRLRTPTVAHHLKVLRLAGLIYISSRPNQKEMYYKTRFESIESMQALLAGFIAEE